MDLKNIDLKKISLPNLKKLDKKLISKLALAIIVIIILIIIMIIAKILIGNRVSYSKIENMMAKAAKEYYSTSQEGIERFKTVGNNELSINSDTLTDEGYLKELSKIIPEKDETCSGKVTVKTNNGYTLYTPYLDCGDAYKTKFLKEVITSSTVESGNGLYIVGNEYIFRGEKLNNYVSFANKTWLIIKVKENGTIRIMETTKRDRIVWDDRYNTTVGFDSGINDFSISRIKDSLINLYDNDEEFTDSERGYITPFNLCIGSRSEDETINDGSIECSKVIENQMLGLIQINEYFFASLDSNCHNTNDDACKNYNYLATLDWSYWSITTGTTKTSKVYKLVPEPNLVNASTSAGIRAVIELDANSIYVSGNGSLESPYIIK